MRLLAIDPGKRAGWAVFETPAHDCANWGVSYLLICGLTDGDDPDFDHSGLSDESPHFDRVVVERPSGSDRRAPSDDLISCGIRAGICVGRVSGPVEWIYAVQWKGSAPKAIQNDRDKAKISGAEYDVLALATNTSTGKRVNVSSLHNVLDAIGIGLWAVGRK